MRPIRMVLGFVFRPLYILGEPLARVPLTTLLAGSCGLVLGLVIALLLVSTLSLNRLPGPAGVILPIVLTLILGYLGVHVFLRKQNEFIQFFARSSQVAKPSQKEQPPRPPEPRYLIIDTSAIIDGRIADITHTGFLQGTLIVPNFILNELRHIADSSDSARRNRGRRGLEVLNKLSREKHIPIQTVEASTAEGLEVDNRLVNLAKTMPASLITADFNLGKVAEFQGVKVLNIHELVSSLKPTIFPNDEMEVRIIQEGGKPAQGIAFLDDGTMIVVEGGKPYIGSEVNIVVTRVIQTATGHIIFAQPKRS